MQIAHRRAGGFAAPRLRLLEARDHLQAPAAAHALLDLNPEHGDLNERAVRLERIVDEVLAQIEAT
jgi:hypothetical protein